MSFDYVCAGRLMRLRVAMVVLAATCWAHSVSAQPAQQDRPLEVRVTGTLLPITDENREDLVTVKVFVADQPWLLRVGAVEKLTSTERERAVDEGVLMRQVRFYGPAELISQLQKPDIVGKVLIIEGQLNTEERRFRVIAVKESKSGDAQDQVR
jgi:hypothetical protein